MRVSSRNTLTAEKLEALATSLSSGNVGQIAIALDLLARVTQERDQVRILIGNPTGQRLLRRCLQIASEVSFLGDAQVDALGVLRHAIAVPEGDVLFSEHEAVLRSILVTPPPRPAAKDLHGLQAATCPIRAAWLAFVLAAVSASPTRRNAVIEGSADLADLFDVTLELCEGAQDAHIQCESLILLRHLYDGFSQLRQHHERRHWQHHEGSKVGADQTTPIVVYPPTEAVQPTHEGGASLPESARFAHLVRRSFSDPELNSEVLLNMVYVVACVGHSAKFRAALFDVSLSELEMDQLDVARLSNANLIIGRFFDLLLQPHVEDSAVWRSMSAVSETKFVRRLMRVHPKVRSMFQCLLSSLDISCASSSLTEHIVAFLKQIFTGATDQFLSMDSTIFDNLGRERGLDQLLSALLRSWKVNRNVAHHANIVAFLADAMFFSSFTDTWQMHPQGTELIGMLFDSLLCKGVEGTAGLALGNFVSANGHIDLILDHVGAPQSISNVGWFLKRTLAGWDTKMQVYYLWRILRSRKGCYILARHPHADLVVAGLARAITDATIEDNEVLSLLEYFLYDEETRPIVLRGNGLWNILSGAYELLSSGDAADLQEPVCSLLQALLDATGIGAFLVQPGARQLVPLLSRISAGKAILDRLMPVLQWSWELTTSLSLSYKRDWISDQIRVKEPGVVTTIIVDRADVLQSFSEGLAKCSSLQDGFDVAFKGDAGETGAGSGHRREFFCLFAAEIMSQKHGLFVSTDGGRRFHPRPFVIGSPPSLYLFEQFGTLLALALLHQEVLPSARFTLALRKMILGNWSLEAEDMASVDREFYEHKVSYILESRYSEGSLPMNLDDLELFFEDIVQPTTHGATFWDKHELFPGGASVPVKEENREHYVDLLCDFRMRGCVQNEVSAIMKGIQRVISNSLLEQIQRLVSPEELDLLLCGLEEINIDDWKENSISLDGVDDLCWNSFWAVVESFSLEERKELLMFVTGSPAPPVGGFATLPGYGSIGSVQRFTLARTLKSSLPLAATCFNTLYLPAFASDAELRSALLEAIANREAGGFFEGAVAT